MPADSQTLYFHLGMSADDDGVVEAWSVLKAVGSSEDNLRVLASKGFITVMNEDLVSVILDWQEHNLIRADRIQPSVYRELLIRIVPEFGLTEPKARSDVSDNTKRLVAGQSTDGLGEDRVGEESLNSSASQKEKFPKGIQVPEPSESKKSPRKVTPEMESIFAVFTENPERELWGRIPIQREAATILLAKFSIEAIRDMYLFAQKHKHLGSPPVDSPNLLLKNFLWLKSFEKSTR